MMPTKCQSSAESTLYKNITAHINDQSGDRSSQRERGRGVYVIPAFPTSNGD